jgi:hypothetical protein
MQCYDCWVTGREGCAGESCPHMKALVGRTVVTVPGTVAGPVRMAGTVRVEARSNPDRFLRSDGTCYYCGRTAGRHIGGCVT